MSRVLLLGVGPLPAPGQTRVHATGLRLEAFIHALAREGYTVLLGEMTFGGEVHQIRQRQQAHIYAHRLIGPSMKEAVQQIEQWIREMSPDAIVALTDVGALAVAKTDWEGPLWVDYFGHPMAERQQQGAAHNNDAALAEQWLNVLPVLLRADHFSVCSPAQRLALLGELGVAGRLNSQTCGQSLVHIIPPTLPFREPFSITNSRVFFKYNIPIGSRVIVSTGGFNTWMDEETLFKGLEYAIERDPRIVFVVTGGAIPGHVEVVFNRFKERALRGRFGKHFFFLGWLTHEEHIDVLMHAHVGVNCDHNTLEGELGCRNRLFSWLWAGLRVVTTVTSQSTQALVDLGLAHAVPNKYPGALGSALVEEAGRGRWENAEAVRETLLVHCNGEEEFEELRRWAKEPLRARDRLRGHSVSNPLADLQMTFMAHARRVATEASLRVQVRELAQTLLGSRMFRALYGEKTDVRKRLEEMADL